MSEAQTEAPTVEYAYMSDLLKEFRLYLEDEAGLPIQNMYFNAALLLEDLCDFLGISPENRAKVLGTSGALHIQQFISQRCTLKEHVH
jgi:hypothetical protein